MRTEIFDRAELSLILESRGELQGLCTALQKAHFAMFRAGEIDGYYETICELHKQVEAALGHDRICLRPGLSDQCGP